ncbi:MAG: CDP-glucose 4,6-dehydratase [Pseudomonadota bacterium]|nr:CDP-glucose 4,6-dehydratase [Pseudomonadota bacterium]
MIDKEFWQNKKVLVTGHTGFKGSWLSLWLNLLGAEVFGYALPPRTEIDNFVLTNLQQRIDNNLADIRDYHQLLNVFQQSKPEIVFHLAAQPIVRESYRKPKETFDINLGGTVNLLECCRLTESVQVIINITSDKCYENREQFQGYREEDRLGGFDPYSSSKAGSEIISTAYRQSFFNPKSIKQHRKSLATARAGNVIGGGDWQSDRLLPDCLVALHQNRPMVIRNPNATRPWQHVLEPLSGYLVLAEKMFSQPEIYQGAWNFGPSDESVITVAQLADIIVTIWDSGSWEKIPDKNGTANDEPHESTLLKLDISKAKTVLHWTPRWDIVTSLKKTIDWYKEFFRDPGNMYDYAVKQIREYQIPENQAADE